jgi:phosphoribosylformylglycinamidine cyclo-ligase
MPKKITYKEAGVDVDLADEVLSSLGETMRSTFRQEVMGRMGGFAGLFRPRWSNYQDPVLVSSTDGVGTKLKIAFLSGIHDTVGIDLVAMNVNDLLVTGAEPLFFLDYFATGALAPEIMKQVVSGIAEGCRMAGCALIGGETAEMPDFYTPGEYDLAGFTVGIVDGNKIIDGSTILPGDLVIGVKSSGLHSNGFSLVRKALFGKSGYTVDSYVEDLGKTLGEELLTPTIIYVQPILEMLKDQQPSGMVHITGGGFSGNIPRVVPSSCSININWGSWPVPPIFRLLQKSAGLEEKEMSDIFNMGIGFVIISRPEQVDSITRDLKRNQLESWTIGEVVGRTSGSQPTVSFQGIDRRK